MHLTIKYKIILSCVLASGLTVLMICWLSQLNWQLTLLSILISTALATLLSSLFSRSYIAGMQALNTGLLNLKDGELATLLAYDKQDELGQLCQLYNQTAKQLRQEKQWLYQRELMLDKVLQSSEQAVFLKNDNDFIVYSNHSARDIFKATTALEGSTLSELLQRCHPQLKNVLSHAEDGLFTLDADDKEPQTWHLATGQLLLNNQYHTLFILKQLTRELSRQEVAVWKKVIRIISHELNNSLGPMSSMLHSGKILTEQLNEPRLKRVFNTIEERIKHLNNFVQGYGKFAKLPTPQRTLIDWPTLVEQLQTQWSFHADIANDVKTLADQMQLEQLLINLLKNAQESGSSAEHINLQVTTSASATQISISDAGKGMSETVMANALVPFYSTKANGSGLGLALCREIVEAHHGQISLHNRKPKGLSVLILLPN